jgi:hypothetical protein
VVWTGRRNTLVRAEADRTARDLDAVLQRVESHWAAQGVPVARHLAPGLSDGEIDELLAAAGPGLELDEASRALYRWHDGAGLADGALDASMPGRLHFRSLREAIAFWRGPWRAAGPLFAVPEAGAWFPLFQEPGALGGVVVPAGASRPARLSPIRRASLPAPPADWPEKAGLLTWFTSLLVWLENGYVRWNPAGAEWVYDESVDLTTYRATWWW